MLETFKKLGLKNLDFSISIGTATLKGSELSMAYSAVPGGLRAETELEDMTLCWEILACGSGFTAQLTAKFPAAINAVKLMPLTLTRDFSTGARIYKHHGLESGYFTVGELDSTSNDAIYIYEEGQGLFCRTVAPLRFRDRFDLARKADGIHVDCNVEPPVTFTSDVFQSPRVFFGVGDMQAMMQDYAALLPDVSRKTAPQVGYNTWDYYYTDIDEACVEENLRAIAANPVYKDKLKYFIIDDGWHHIQGDWYANYRFPHGLEHLAGMIRDAGLIPGIWTAPVHVAPLSSLAQRRMTFHCPDKHGDPIDNFGMFVLDPTNPDCQAYLRELYTRLYKAGFRAFKVDFVSCLVSMDRFWDKSAGQYDALRTLFALLRECVGEDSTIIGCSLPVEAASPDADSGRTGIDIHIHWTHVKWAMESYQYRWIHQNKIWNNDIDFCIVRGPETDNDPKRSTIGQNAPDPKRRWRTGPEFSLDEARTWASVVLATGGNLYLSDRLSMLNEIGTGILERALTHKLDEPAVPVDQFYENYPCVWKQLDNGLERFTLINWEDSERTISITCPVGTYRDLWTDEEYVSDGTVTVNLRAHASVVLQKQ